MRTEALKADSGRQTYVGTEGDGHRGVCNNSGTNSATTQDKGTESVTTYKQEGMLLFMVTSRGFASFIRCFQHLPQFLWTLYQHSGVHWNRFLPLFMVWAVKFIGSFHLVQGLPPYRHTLVYTEKLVSLCIIFTLFYSCQREPGQQSRYSG
jgi:hypothetical protein